MSENDEVIELASKVVRCVGDDTEGHGEVELILAHNKVVACPACGRQYRRSGPYNSIAPAVWPDCDKPPR